MHDLKVQNNKYTGCCIKIVCLKILIVNFHTSYKVYIIKCVTINLKFVAADFTYYTHII